MQPTPEPVPWSPLVAIQSAGTRRPFYCVHGLGGHTVLFGNVARYLGDDQPLFAFRAWGVEEGQEPFTRVEDMAACYVEALRNAQPEGPYLLGGYSMGGIVAFEMAQQLQAQRQEVAILAIIDIPAQSPRLRYLRQLTSQLGAVLGMRSDQQLRIFLRLRHYLSRLNYFRRLKPANKEVYLREKLSVLLKKHGPEQKPPTNPFHVYDDTQVDSPVPQHIRNLGMVNERAYRTYIPRRYQGRVALIRSMRGYAGDPDNDYYQDELIGWDKVVSGAIETYVVPGSHLEIIREPHVKLLAAHLRTCLDKAQH